LPTNTNYTDIINRVRDNVLKKKALIEFARFELWLNAIDQDGQACTKKGNDILDRIATKFESDFSKFDTAQMIDYQDSMFSRAAWLYASTPDNVIAYVKEILTEDFTQQRWGWAVEAASRTFTLEEEFHTLFKAIARRARRSIAGFQSFPIQSARAICRVLMFRENGEKGLNGDMATLFTRRALDRLYKEQKRQNFNILYFQLILLLLYLLRYRKAEPACFDPNSPQTIEVFENAMQSMSVAKKFFSKKRIFGKARRVQYIIDGFEKYLHYEGTEDLPTVIGGFTGDMA